MGLVRQDETQWPDDMRGLFQQHLALAKRLADQAKLVILQIPQSAMDQFAGRRGGGTGEIALLAEPHAQAAPCRIVGDAAAVDAAPDDISRVNADAHLEYLLPQLEGRIFAGAGI